MRKEPCHASAAWFWLAVDGRLKSNLPTVGSGDLGATDAARHSARQSGDGPSEVPPRFPPKPTGMADKKEESAMACQISLLAPGSAPPGCGISGRKLGMPMAAMAGGVRFESSVVSGSACRMRATCHLPRVTGPVQAMLSTVPSLFAQRRAQWNTPARVLGSFCGSLLKDHQQQHKVWNVFDQKGHG